MITHTIMHLKVSLQTPVPMAKVQLQMAFLGQCRLA